LSAGSEVVGCQIEQQDFRAATPIGNIAMENIIAKSAGTTSGDIILYATHYDTLNMPEFVGADDGGSGTGVMLELARNVCSRKHSRNVWVAFFDGEEAQGRWADKKSVNWTDGNSTFGSREMASRVAQSGDITKVKAMILADMIGPANLRIKRETNSTPWLMNLIWETAARLGYDNNFVSEDYPISGDDHFSFLRHGVPAYDIIDFSVGRTYWHTPQDTLDKVDPRSLQIVGHVLLETLAALERKLH
jgi:Zn-dependent M28 family amino/carboxypeptidase